MLCQGEEGPASTQEDVAARLLTRNLYKLPQLLILHLKRFKFGEYGGGRKIDTSVILHQTLDLTSFVKGSSGKRL